jgi:hypothetical protein
VKQITNKTLLKQGDKTYQPIEIDGVIYWVDRVRHMTEYVTNGSDIFKPVEMSGYTMEYAQRYWQKLIAQSQPKLDGIPVVSLNENILSDIETITSWDSFKDHPIGKAGKKIEKWFKSNPNQYTQEDIEKVIMLSRLWLANYPEGKNSEISERLLLDHEILEKINSISVIEVDEQFNVISYE